MDRINIFWFRRDLRIDDNAGLYFALKGSLPVLPIFIFDKNILDGLENKSDARVQFIHDVIKNLHQELVQLQSSLEVFYNTPENVFKLLLTTYNIQTVYTNNDYELYAGQRDELIEKLLHTHKAELKSFKDQVIFEKDELVKDDAKPYTVFTPYSNKWKAKVDDLYLSLYPTKSYLHNLFKLKSSPVISLDKLGFNNTSQFIPSREISIGKMKLYDKTRDYPAIDGTSRIGIHLRFGTVSIRHLTALAKKINSTYLNELIWRDFYFAILYHFPHVGQHRAFKPEYEFIEWRNNEDEFYKWCSGETGYPIVDAGMRQLNTTGYMHNRVRMITASFLSKHLLIDWRWGEAYFAEKLLDFDFSANNGGWQWVAGCGCDASPYFRIFNPWLQTKKFDPNLDYIKKWVPEFQEFDYPKPIVDHEFARKRCLDIYSKALKPK